MASLLELRPEDAAAELQKLGTRRAYFVWTGGQLKASHPQLEETAAAIASDDRDYDAHEAVFFEVGRESDRLLGGFLHRTLRGQGAGGVRYWGYDTVGSFVRDGLRLSRGMGRKNALAGLWWGGGKGVISRDADGRFRDPAHRTAVFRDYGRFITSLRGAYITAEDAGTVASDMADIYRETRFCTCVPQAVGGSGNPSFATAGGVVCAMEAAVEFTVGGSLSGKRVAMQGAGNVGTSMIERLVERGAEVVVADVDAAQIEAVRARFAGAPVEARTVERGDDGILFEACDVLAPNALGGVLGPDTIARIQAKIVCGAANNQLLDDRRDDAALAERGILYVPDFLANRMGIVNCANEQYGSIPDDPAITRHLEREWDQSIYRTTLRVLERARSEAVTPARAANALADELAAATHPIWGHRTRAIIDSLVSEGWASGG